VADIAIDPQWLAHRDMCEPITTFSIAVVVRKDLRGSELSVSIGRRAAIGGDHRDRSLEARVSRIKTSMNPHVLFGFAMATMN